MDARRGEAGCRGAPAIPRRRFAVRARRRTASEQGAIHPGRNNRSGAVRVVHFQRREGRDVRQCRGSHGVRRREDARSGKFPRSHAAGLYRQQRAVANVGSSVHSNPTKETVVPFTRRDFGKLAAATLPAARLMAKPNSKFNRVRIGAITYSFRALPGSAEEVLRYCVDCGISAIELMSNVAEGYAGSPAAPVRGRVGGQGQATPEQREARRKAAEEISKWRRSVPMSKYKAFRKLYEDAGVKIYAFKLPSTLAMRDAEYEYIWNVAETLGADHITMELPSDDKLLQRVAEYAAKRKLNIAFHTHGEG